MPQYQASNPGPRRAKETVRPLPKGFMSLRELQDGNAKQGKIVNVVGLVKDCRAPIKTGGTDYKSTVTLCDKDTDEQGNGLVINIFRRHEASMPTVAAGDVVIVFQAKVQFRGDTCSLLTSRQTDIHVYDVLRLSECTESRSARAALRKPTRDVRREPTAEENEYVLWLFVKIDKTELPDPDEFSVSMRNSLNVKDKFTLLKDVKVGKFADLLVQVVKEPYNLGDSMTVWVSDYTMNSSFFHKTTDRADCVDGVPVRDGDPYGYTNGRKKQSQAEHRPSDWDGPVGKMSIQLTCWDPHASFIREKIHMKDWVRLRNVRIVIGRNSANLEGKMDTDRDYPDRCYIEVLNVYGERETVDPRLVDAVRRKRDYEKKHERSLKTGEKRKAAEAPKTDNARSKRQKKRGEQRKAKEEEETRKQAALGFNNLVISENEDKAIVPLSTILDPVIYETTIADQQVHLVLPFTCALYRTNVRVVDFFPDSLQDFAVRRPLSEYDMLRDNDASDSDGSASSHSSSSTTHHHTHTRDVWEWCFALQLEEAAPKAATPARAWAFVDHHDAQLLLDLDDACDLRRGGGAAGEQLLATLRERLFTLWGNLEERKAARRRHGEDPLRVAPPDSSDAEGAPAAAAADEEEEGGGPAGSQLSNRPFTCCLQQYGVKVKVRAGEDEEASAGKGRRWQRMFGLFGTKIRVD